MFVTERSSESDNDSESVTSLPYSQLFVVYFRYRFTERNRVCRNVAIINRESSCHSVKVVVCNFYCHYNKTRQCIWLFWIGTDLSDSRVSNTIRFRVSSVGLNPRHDLASSLFFFLCVTMLIVLQNTPDSSNRFEV